MPAKCKEEEQKKGEHSQFFAYLYNNNVERHNISYLNAKGVIVTQLQNKYKLQEVGSPFSPLSYLGSFPVRKMLLPPNPYRQPSFRTRSMMATTP